MSLRTVSTSDAARENRAPSRGRSPGRSVRRPPRHSGARAHSRSARRPRAATPARRAARSRQMNSAARRRLYHRPSDAEFIWRERGCAPAGVAARGRRALQRAGARAPLCRGGRRTLRLASALRGRAICPRAASEVETVRKPHRTTPWWNCGCAVRVGAAIRRGLARAARSRRCAPNYRVASLTAYVRVLTGMGAPGGPHLACRLGDESYPQDGRMYA